MSSETKDDYKTGYTKAHAVVRTTKKNIAGVIGGFVNELKDICNTQIPRKASK